MGVWPIGCVLVGIAACGGSAWAPEPGSFDAGLDAASEPGIGDGSTRAEAGVDGGRLDAIAPVMDAGEGASIEVDAGSCSAADEGCDELPRDPPCRELAPLASGAVCRVTAGTNALLLTGELLTPSGTLRAGQLALDAEGVITCVGCDCSAAAGAGATRVECPRGVISPGLVNAHDHLAFTHQLPYAQTPERYEQRHDFRRGLRGHSALSVSGGASETQLRWGELRFVMGGATSTLGEGGTAGLLRNLDDAALLEGLDQPAAQTETFPLDDFDGQQRDGDCNYGPSPDTAATISTDAYVAHVAEGIDAVARNEWLCVSSTQLDTTPPGLSDDLRSPHSAFTHAIALQPSDFARMAAAGSALVWSPRSNLALYGDTAAVTVAARLGVRIALGSDWMPTGSMNVLRELACADHWNQRYLGGYFDDEALWRMVTVEAAAVAGMDGVLGSLAPGLVGDVAIFDGSVRPWHRAVIAAEPADVVLVLRGGRVLYGDAEVVAELPGGASCERAGEVCGVPKRVCALDDVGASFAALQSDNAALYPAYFCGAPADEPSCHPERSATPGHPSGSVEGSSLYDGTITGADHDGDGIADLADACPEVFDPVRPVDDGVQADYDADGEGDACDSCPLDPDTRTCSAFDPDDGDVDGVADEGDNCPFARNPGQADADADGKGDACDGCPDEPNPGAQACAVSIYAIKDGTVRPDTAVRVRNALVTGKGSNGFFVQVAEADVGYRGADDSGLFVFTASSGLDDALVPGNRVDLDGMTGAYQGQRQLASLSALVVASAAVEPAPAPVLATAAELTTGGARAAALEGVLVELHDAAVTTTLDANNELTVTDASSASLRIDDYLYLIEPSPLLGDVFQVARGVLALRSIGGGQSASKLLPRAAGDLVPAP